MPAELNLSWAQTLINQLVSAGITNFYLSPGKRNIPLVKALTTLMKNRLEIKIHLAVDERGGAFRALGYAKASKNPPVLICTSGSALANYYPAVLEAFYDEIPLIIISADRPEELIDVSANQTCQQQNFYHNFVVDNLNLPAPNPAFPLAELINKFNHIINLSITQRAPVHINFPFREPLLCSEPAGQIAIAAKKKMFHLTKTPPTYLPILEEKIRQAKKGLLLVGNLRHIDDIQAVSCFIKKLSWPTYLDIGSNLKHNHPNILFDISTYTPDVIIHIGGRLVLNHFPTLDAALYLHLDTRRLNFDPAHTVDIKLRVENFSFLQEIDCKTVAIVEPFNLIRAEEIPLAELTFANTVKKINEIIPNKTALFLGNSTTVRAFDSTTIVGPAKSIPLFTNRGVSGIEGHIACTIGIADSLQYPTWAVFGDLAFIHDLNSLQFLNKSETPITLIIMNNYGGKIFEKVLPDEQDLLNPWVINPHHWNFKYIAKQFKIDFHLIENLTYFTKHLTAATKSNRHTILEVSLPS